MKRREDEHPRTFLAALGAALILILRVGLWIALVVVLLLLLVGEPIGM